MKKYLKVTLILVVVLSLLCTFALAAGNNPFKSAMDTAVDKGNANTLNDRANAIGGSIISVVQTIGYIVAVVMVLYIGIQWLIGTPAKKQELKGKMFSLVIGAVLVAGGVTILGWIADVANDMGVEDNGISSISLKA